METEKIELIEKFNKGVATVQETLFLEKMVAQGTVSIAEIESLYQLSEKIDQQPEAVASVELDHRFYEMLAKEKRKQSPFTFALPEWKIVFPRLAVACSLLLIGFFVGHWFQKPISTGEVAQLTQQVESLKEMMMISLLEKESATERLKAVSLTHELAGPSEKVTTALLKTLNSDPNTNVRLAALDALQGYANIAEVRAGLVHSITLQKSPLVQVALAELMVAIQEKSSVSALKKVMDEKATPKEVKEKIKKSIDVLI